MATSASTGIALAAALCVAAAGQEYRHSVPLFGSVPDSAGRVDNNERQGFVRVVNKGDEPGDVSIVAFDDAGVQRGPVTLALAGRQTRHFNTDDLRDGNADKGLSGRIGAPTRGDWRLELRTELDLLVLAYLRTKGDGFLTSMHDLAPQQNGTHHIPTFNPGRNSSQRSKLRLINPGEQAAVATVRGVDDQGEAGAQSVRVSIPAGGARTLSAQQLEAGGADVDGRFGTGRGKWRLEVTADQAIQAMSLLDSPTGHITNLSTKPANATTAGGVTTHRVHLFPQHAESTPADDPVVRQGFLRIVNRSAETATIDISAVDDDPSTSHDPVSLRIDAGKTTHFNSQDLEQGNPGKGIPEGVGDGNGTWRLALRTEQEVEVLAYIRTSDGFLTSMHDVAPANAARSYQVAIANPGRNTDQKSSLRLVNDGDRAATVSIAGRDDRGNDAQGTVRTSIPAGAAVTLTAQALEAGEGVTGALGSGGGKWQLTVDSSQPIRVMSLMETPTGHLTNLSTTTAGEQVDDGGGEEAGAREFFRANIAVPVVQSRCINCHVAGGASGSTRLVFQRGTAAGQEQHNFDQFRNYVATVANGAAVILDKIQGLRNHGGSIQISRGSDDFANMQRFLALLDEEEERGVAPNRRDVGHPTFASPHARPIAINGGYVYVANTPADTVDVIDRTSRRIVKRIDVGVDPVSVVARPDGREVWVANHISDSVSVIDTNPASAAFHHVVATVQDVDASTLSTRFDEPVGVAFANNRKAYVALSTSNRIAVVDVSSRTVTKHLPIRAQDPRAMVVRDDSLYVIPFESNNQSQLSGCRVDVNPIDGDVCTFDAVEHVFSNNNVLSEGYDADIVKNPRLPDRDLFVFDTRTDRRRHVVSGLGTLLYGLAVDSRGRVFVAQTDARNVENGRAGTRKHGLAEMENRAFLNQISRVTCLASSCARQPRFDLEPLPPEHPPAGMALATPFGIQVSDDDATLVATAAGSNKLFTVNANDGTVLGRVAVGAAPRGIALVSASSGAPRQAWVLNAVENSVSVVDLQALDAPRVAATIALDDPTEPVLKQGRIAFNAADASSTGTFSCESCHPDGHTDQLIWVLHTPNCGSSGERLDRDGCTQVPPRLTMPVRGLRDTQPYHWDGIPGDPYGGRNTRSIDATESPNCDVDDPASCTRHLVDGSLATTMCQVAPTGEGIDPVRCRMRNDENKEGLLDAADRDALAEFILNIPFPPSQTRPFHNTLTKAAQQGFFEFSYLTDSSGRTTGAQTCGACHKMPFLVSTNTPGTGMEAPTWRGAYDRWMITPQARLNIIDLLDIVNMDDSFPERDMWILGGATPNVWEMVTEGSTGFPGGFARQVTLNANTANDALTLRILDALEAGARDEAVILQAEGTRLVDGEAAPVALQFKRGSYEARDGSGSFYRSALVDEAARGDLVLTLTARLGPNVGSRHPQPALWPEAPAPDERYCASESCWNPVAQQRPAVNIAFLADDTTLQVSGRHVSDGALIFVDGRRVGGDVRCATGGVLPACDDERLVVDLNEAPEPGGLHFLQLQNPGGLVSNDMMFFSEQSPMPPRPGNLISSGGTFAGGNFDDLRDREAGRPNNWNTVELATNSINVAGGEVRVDLREASDDPWRAQISHAVMVVGGQEYTLCYRAKAAGERFITAYMDTNRENTNSWSNVSDGQHRANLTRSYRSFQHTFTIAETDLMSRVAFDFAQSAIDVQIDDIGLYEGASCGQP